ncbi:probable protein phosphatase 2C 40 isoform X2 [Amborella trichopoda]|uniref:PPM-type phosphatase domain-containing protein n=1 Tax=Amborella trichopoda TaxID=13333 RepID=W1P3I3_AMBTC|nr:probable protein phosphatase 2C 40 isoform X2 [Amborella trichopoda]ERN02174.1 hypothetical protein AMTR_s00045p00196960 [Amborella trichopoda]|eukprot:XP_006840499.1 probable protein phosphatase 2C 40 isoform X2 [Amborella trichopoda]
MLMSEKFIEPDGELNVSFGYQWNNDPERPYEESYEPEAPRMCMQSSRFKRNSSFSCLSGAALSANATLANTNICNGLIGSEILPSLDSPRSFRRIPSSPSLSNLDILSSSFQSTVSTLSCSFSTQNEISECESSFLKPMSAPAKSEGFLNAMDLQVAGGAAGEDRVQAVHSEDNGWLFCAIYDGFNGRDAADFLAGTLYENIGFHLNLLEWHMGRQNVSALNDNGPEGSMFLLEGCNPKEKYPLRSNDIDDSFRHGVVDCLHKALAQAENDFMYMVEHEMDGRPDLVSVGSCVLVVLLHGKDLYTLNLGDSRAVLATKSQVDHEDENKVLKAIQLTDSHTVDNEKERMQLLADHCDDPVTIVAGRVKGKLRLTRAFGVGYLKKGEMNDALMGILRVRNLLSPPYIGTDPSVNIHRITECDEFVIIGSDGLFDFFSNIEAVQLVYSFISRNPSGDPAKFLLEELVKRAAANAGFSTEELMRVPAGRRRKYHDDVTVMVILLGNDNCTSTASTSL